MPNELKIDKADVRIDGEYVGCATDITIRMVDEKEHEKLIDSIKKRFKQQIGREPSDEEIAEQLSLMAYDEMEKAIKKEEKMKRSVERSYQHQYKRGYSRR